MCWNCFLASLQHLSWRGCGWLSWPLWPLLKIHLCVKTTVYFWHDLFLNRLVGQACTTQNDTQTPYGTNSRDPSRTWGRNRVFFLTRQVVLSRQAKNRGFGTTSAQDLKMKSTTATNFAECHHRSLDKSGPQVRLTWLHDYMVTCNLDHKFRRVPPPTNSTNLDHKILYKDTIY